MKVRRSRIESQSQQYMKSIETIKRHICKIMKVRVIIKKQTLAEGNQIYGNAK